MAMNKHAPLCMVIQRIAVLWEIRKFMYSHRELRGVTNESSSSLYESYTTPHRTLLCSRGSCRPQKGHCPRHSPNVFRSSANSSAIKTARRAGPRDKKLPRGQLPYICKVERGRAARARYFREFVSARRNVILPRLAPGYLSWR